jgi:hypothetical protein
MPVKYDPREIEKLFEGKYVYSKDGESFSQEEFKVFKRLDTTTLVYQSEILSRVSTGELLKIECNYEINNQWSPVEVNVEKHLGDMYSEESYYVNANTQSVNYEFRTQDKVVNKERPTPPKFQISTPAFLTSMLCTQQKSFSSMGRSQFSLLASNNEWECRYPLEDQYLYIEYKSHENEDIVINGQELANTRCSLYRHDAIENVQERPTIVYLSKHIGIPYVLEIPQENLRIEIKTLKKTEKYNYDDLFKDLR